MVSILKILDKHTEIESIVEKFHIFNGHLNPEDYKTLCDYRDALKGFLDDKEFILEETNNPEEASQHFDKLQEEYNWIYYLGLADARVSLHTMHDIFYFGIDHVTDSSNAFFTFKKLVDQVNCYWNITEPYKPSNKIAYGWKFSLDKGNASDGYKGRKLYLFGCIKNYLIKNGINFDKETSLEIRKIVRLSSITEGDS